MCIYALSPVHLVKPEAMEEYLDDFNMFANMMRERTNAHLCGSWTCLIGDQDEAGNISQSISR